MHRSILAAAALTFAAPAAQHLQPRPPIALASASIAIEYHLTHDEAVLIVETESGEVLEHVEVVDPIGTTIFEFNAGVGCAAQLSGLRFESVGDDIEALLENSPPGVYEIIGRTPDGRFAIGYAELSHRLIRPPAIHYPRQGFTNVPTSNLLLTWTPNPAAAGYELVLEQDDNDGMKVKLGAGTSSFRVSDGFLAPNTLTYLEVIAVGPEGNRTAIEVSFTTQ